MLVGFGIASDNNMLYAGLIALINTHLQINRVVIYGHINRNDSTEKIAIVHVEVMHSIVVHKKPLIQQGLVKHIPFLNPKHLDRKSTRLNSSHVRISYAV